MPVALRKHGVVWADFELVEGFLGKTVSLRMMKDGQQPVELLTISVVGDHIVYSSAGNQPVLGGVREPGKEGAEFATRKDVAKASEDE